MSAPADHLPYIDEHTVEVDAVPGRAWEALTRVVEGTFASSASGRGARLLGCADVASAGPRPFAVGSALPGFHVDAAEAPRELALAGSHRFSEYALIFRLDALDGNRTRLRAETRAEFPGLRGSAYRAMVIGTRMHVLVTRRLLTSVKHRAERD